MAIFFKITLQGATLAVLANSVCMTYQVTDWVNPIASKDIFPTSVFLVCSMPKSSSCLEFLLDGGGKGCPQSSGKSQSAAEAPTQSPPNTHILTTGDVNMKRYQRISSRDIKRVSSKEILKLSPKLPSRSLALLAKFYKGEYLNKNTLK